MTQKSYTKAYIMFNQRLVIVYECQRAGNINLYINYYYYFGFKCLLVIVLYPYVKND